MLTLEDVKKIYESVNKKTIKSYEKEIDNIQAQMKHCKIHIKDAEYLNANHEKNIEECNECLSIINEKEFDYVKSLINDRIDRIKTWIAENNNSISYEKQYLERYTERLAKTITRLSDAMDDNSHISKAKEIFKEIQNIQELKTIKDVSLDSSFIFVRTVDLNITEPKYGNTYPLGEMEIQIPLENTYGQLRVFNKTKRVYGYTEGMNHPHIFSNGEPCWGTASDNVYLLYSNKQYYLLVITILAFLQNCDIEDDAGRFVPSWAKGETRRMIYMHSGNIVEFGSDESCAEAYCEIEDEYYYASESRFPRRCEICGYDGCSDCVETYEIWNGELRMICQNCLEDCVKCEECGGLLTSECEKFEVSDGYICLHCLEEEDYQWDEELGYYVKS